ncbi:uncharacterized protein CTRU02_210287 [Colletotrichum truncatum]|uniref:Uncharacterized protein n=1 Tax=Colletotrichum truncatum TaxID=5467 RepID=A0ACC3YUX0_COLTU|nr:uncharacterized protein CTRU02_11500 [Colletotrichum truncatum]KAF6785875.1 hypothetical protein CTRU02_11500 [Colletotrichum truncatum]
MSNNKAGPGGIGNSSNPRPGQSPFPPSGPLVRQSNQPYTSSYSNNFDRTNSRYSTGRSEDPPSNQDTRSPPSPEPRRQTRQEQAGRAYEESIYGMYGDMNSPRDPPPRQNQQSRRQYRQEQQDDEDSYDEEVPRRPEPEAQRPRYSRARTSPGPGQRRSNTNRPNQQYERQNRQDRRDRRDQQDQQEGDGNYRRVNINIDTGTDGSRSWSFRNDDRDRANVNIGIPFGGSGPSLVNFDVPFGNSGFPFGGRNNGGGRLPVNVPFVNGLPVNLPFGL